MKKFQTEQKIHGHWWSVGPPITDERKAIAGVRKLRSLGFTVRLMLTEKREVEVE